MTLEDILKFLSVEKLDESQQNLLKEKIDTLIDVKSRERADVLLKEEKEVLIKEFETKFEDYKSDITSKFSNFVDSVLDEELQIPEKVLKYAHKGELYDELIEQFKIRLAIDEGVLDKEVKSLLKEAKDEILSLKGTVNELTAEKMELEDDAKEMAANLYLRKKCDGLTESGRNKIFSILGDVRDKAEIDRKFKYVVENIINEELPKGDEMPAAEGATNVNICAKCGATYTAPGEDGIAKCPACGATGEDLVKSIEPAKTDGQGAMEVAKEGESGYAPEPEQVEESLKEETDFDKMLTKWAKILKENKI